MSDASVAFEGFIQDAENLLKHFDSLNTKPPPPEIEVLKRAGLIMAMTAWETYVEDRLLEASRERLSKLRNKDIANFVKAKLDEEIKRLHNPTYPKTAELFQDYAGVDISKFWCWGYYKLPEVKDTLSMFLKLRGDIVHRSRVITGDSALAHPVTKETLQKAIRFLKSLVIATEKAFETA